MTVSIEQLALTSWKLVLLLPADERLSRYACRPRRGSFACWSGGQYVKLRQYRTSRENRPEETSRHRWDSKDVGLKNEKGQSVHGHRFHFRYRSYYNRHEWPSLPAHSNLKSIDHDFFFPPPVRPLKLPSNPGLLIFLPLAPLPPACFSSFLFAMFSVRFFCFSY